MITGGPAQGSAPPSLATLVRTTMMALAVAGAVLTTIVLPAEYGMDPLGTGRWLGLTAIASPPLMPVELTRSGDAVLAPVQAGPVASYPARYRYDVFEVELEPFDHLEYKYQLEQNATMMFSWTATAPIVQEFHGERASGRQSEPSEETYDKLDRQGADGVFSAPFAGIHGWYWENPNADPVTVRLMTSGFYSNAVVIRSDLTRTVRAVRTLDTLMPATRPAVEDRQ